MRRRIAALGVAVCLGLTHAPVANAAISQTRDYSVDVSTGALDGFQTAEVNKGRISWLMYGHPDLGQLPTAFYLDAYVGQERVGFAGKNTEVESGTANGIDVVTLRHTDEALKAELTRRFRVTPEGVEVTVQLRNTSNEERELGINLATGMLQYDYRVHAEQVDGGYSVNVGDRFQLHTRYDGAHTTGTGATHADALKGAKAQDSRFQAAQWSRKVGPGETLEARMTLTGSASELLRDSDGDGFPDEWEKNGFTNINKVEFPLNRWGADPNKPDLFLQLNWMKSEWETKNCSEKRKYAPNEAEFRRFLECSNANANVYRPSRETLNDLVALFEKRGINLHIDAGPYYTNIPGLDERRGGPTIDYTPYYFGKEAPGFRLLRDRRAMLGDRQAVFRVGIIGDSQAEDNMSSGNGLISDGAFYVANNHLMTSQMQLRNTILHEYGHNLGLTHSGTVNDRNRPESAYVPNYNSVMNYMYQFTTFDYSDQVASDTENRPRPKACDDKGVECYTGKYRIQPDWDNLDFVNGEIGKTDGSIGVDPVAPPKAPDIDQLVVMNAEGNIGQAGFRVLSTKDTGNQDQNVIMANRTDSKVLIELSNLGLDLHEYTLKVTYPGGTYTTSRLIEGVLSGNDKVAVEVPIKNTAGYTESTMPVRFQVFNNKNPREQVVDETVNFSVLNLTPKEMDQLMQELREKNSDLFGRAQDTVGKPDVGKPTLTSPAPLSTQPNQPIPSTTPRGPAVTSLEPAPSTQTPNRPATSTPRPTQDATGNTGGGSSDGRTIGIAIGVIVALLAVIGIGAVGANAAGIF